MKDLLLEIYTEEIPASYIISALNSLQDNFLKQISSERLSCKGVTTTGTPRRLILFVQGLPSSQQDRVEVVFGPPAHIGMDANGNLTKAGLGFAKKFDVQAKDVEVRTTEKGEYLAVKQSFQGQPTIQILEAILPEGIRKISFPKSMRWDNSNISFARPIRSILALLGDEVITFTVGNIMSGRTTRGHHFLSDKEITIETADFETYSSIMRKNDVIVLHDERREMISKQIKRLLNGNASSTIDEELLDEVVFLVEYPAVIEGKFDKKHIALPQEVLEEAMKTHQRYFPVKDENGNLLDRFLVVSDRRQNHHDLIRAGNEHVLKARLEDAQFFWREDTKSTLAEKVVKLNYVTFHEKLGTYYDKVERIKELGAFIAGVLHYNQSDNKKIQRCLHLSKADLVTEMVYEFPALQGIMGTEYALYDGEDEEIAKAIREHYLPRYAQDDIPQTDIGIVAAIADKVDSIFGFFAIGLKPTGNQDPYAVRRNAQGLLRILIERNLSLRLIDLWSQASSLYSKVIQYSEEVFNDLARYFEDRLYQMMLAEGFQYDIIRAVLSSRFEVVCDFYERLKALRELAQRPEWDELVELVERTYNISKNTTVCCEVNPALFEQDEERVVWEKFNTVKAPFLRLVKQRDYIGASNLFRETLAETVHTYFDKVYVNVEDTKVRDNRLAMLEKIYILYAENIADLAQVVRENP